MIDKWEFQLAVSMHMVLFLKDIQANSGREIIAHTNYFTVMCLVAWPLHESEAGGDLALIETSLLLLC